MEGKQAGRSSPSNGVGSGHWHGASKDSDQGSNPCCHNGGSTSNSERPIACILDTNKGMFRITRAKGKALSSGGFGIPIPAAPIREHPHQQTGDGPTDELSPARRRDQINQIVSEFSTAGATLVNCRPQQSVPPQRETVVTPEYLFVEEVLFLHERGLLECSIPSEKKSSNNQAEEMGKISQSTKTLDSSQLFQILPTMGISMAIYLVYAHLRSQDFRVLRHDPGRLKLLQEQRQQQILLHEQKKRKQVQDMTNDATTIAVRSTTSTVPKLLTRKEATNLRHRVRNSIAQAPPPAIPDNGLSICWDAYQPNSQFGKTHPGLPDFYVAVSYYNHCHRASFHDVQALLTQGQREERSDTRRHDFCHNIPLKLAMVSDSGTVCMFGVTNFGVPSIKDAGLADEER